MDAINEFDGIDLAVNPLLVIIVIQLILIIIASQRGWGWTPVWLMLGLIGIVIVVGIMTGIGLIPDGVDIFTVLFGSIGTIGSMIYMIAKPKKR